MAFDEVVYPVTVSQRSGGGPMFQTEVIQVRSGQEQRNKNWSLPLYRYNAAAGVRTKADLDLVVAFFNVAGGRGDGFRYKDWQDYSVTDEALVVTGKEVYQLTKAYSNTVRTLYRNILKPRASPAVTMKRGGGAFSAFSIDTTTGLITLTPDVTKIISNITVANPGVVTTTVAHTFSNGDEIFIDGVVGMTEVNNTVFTIANVTASTFEIVDTSTYTAYTSGGTADKHVQSSETLTWTGEFDVPVRFDSDDLMVDMEAFLSLGHLPQIPLIELRTP